MAAIASVALFGFASQSQAALLTHTDSITGSNEVGSVSYFNFDTTAPGAVRLETFSDSFDTFLWLFRDDGDLTRDDQIAFDDDGGTRSQSALSWFNSLINTNLKTGSYIAAVGDFELSLDEAVAGINDSNAFGVGIGPYRLKVEGEFVQASASSNVSEPLTLSLFGLALAGFGAFRRKMS